MVNAVKFYIENMARMLSKWLRIHGYFCNNERFLRQNEFTGDLEESVNIPVKYKDTDIKTFSISNFTCESIVTILESSCIWPNMTTAL